MTEEPLIYTTKGHLPIASLRHEVLWDVQMPAYIKLTERYYLGDEVVKESAHVYSPQGVLASGLSASLG